MYFGVQSCGFEHDASIARAEVQNHVAIAQSRYFEHAPHIVNVGADKNREALLDVSNSRIHQAKYQE